MNLNKDPESWARVSPAAALGGSKAQGENVLKMAIEDIGRLHAELQGAKKPTKRAKPGAAEHVAEINRLRAWVDDLQAGMHVNCVYCGFRYGPNKTTPVSMADALKAHVAVCQEHPMSGLLKALQEIVRPYANLTEEALRAGVRMEFGPPLPDRGLAIWNARVAIAAVSGGVP